MTGKRINKHQIKLFMEHREQNQTQPLSAAMAGFSLRSAQRIETKEKTLSTKPQNSQSLKQNDPFNDVWETMLVPLLEKNPKLQATTLLQYAQDINPEKYSDKLLRTLQRRVQQWKAIHGPAKEVMFLQNHPPGRQSLSDFTNCNELRITINDIPFPHLIYHFWLAFSTWEYAMVITGGESFTALAEGLQNALRALGGVPLTHRTDSLSAAYKNLTKEASEDFTQAYQELCNHYSMEPTRNNKGVKHENGSVEVSHKHLKTRLDQALMIKGHRNFATLPDYQNFVDNIVTRHNQGILNLLQEERKYLKDLPNTRTRDYNVEFVKVSSSSIATIRQVRYSVPSRLIGMQLQVHIFDDRLECYLGATCVITLKRLRWNKGARPLSIDYRHLIESLSRKPQAFRHYIFRNELYPTHAFRMAWDLLDKKLDERSACKAYVKLLKLAAETSEHEVSEFIMQAINEGKIPQVNEEMTQSTNKGNLKIHLEIEERDLKSYESLLPQQGEQNGS